MPAIQAIDPAMAMAPVPDQTPQSQTAPLRYIVQRFDAQSSRFDLRLELDGVLKSWEVGEPPSYFPGDHRIAAKAEDLPIENGLLQGSYEDPNLGRVQVSLWDWGYWSPQQDPHAAIKDGRMVFSIEGGRLQGRWCLEKTGADDKGGEQWSLIKQDDEFALPSQEAAALIQSQMEESSGNEGGQGGGQVFMWMPAHLLVPALVPDAPHPRFNARGEFKTVENRETDDPQDANYNPFFSPQFLQFLPLAPLADIPEGMEEGKMALGDKGNDSGKLMMAAGLTAGVLKQAAEAKSAQQSLLTPVVRDGHVFIISGDGTDVTHLYATMATNLENNLIGSGVIAAQDTPHRPGVVMAPAVITTNSVITSNPGTPASANITGSSHVNVSAGPSASSTITSAAAITTGGHAGRANAEERAMANTNNLTIRELAAGSRIGEGGVITSQPTMNGVSEALAQGATITSNPTIDGTSSGSTGSRIGPGAEITTNSAIGQAADMIGDDGFIDGTPPGMPLAAHITTASTIDTPQGSTVGRGGFAGGATSAGGDSVITTDSLVTGFALAEGFDNVPGVYGVAGAEGVDGGVITTESYVGDGGIIGPDITDDFTASAQPIDDNLPGPGPVSTPADAPEPVAGSPAAGVPTGGEAMEPHLEPEDSPLIFDTPDMMPSFADGDNDGGASGGEDAPDNPQGEDVGGDNNDLADLDGPVIEGDFNEASEGIAAAVFMDRRTFDTIGVESRDVSGYYQDIGPQLAAIAPNINPAELAQAGTVELQMPADRTVFTLHPGEGVTVTELKQGASQIRDALAAQGLASMPMSDGKGTITIIVPEGGLTAESRQTLAKDIAAAAHNAAPASFSLDGPAANRIFIDLAENDKADMTVPFTILEKENAPVSMILDWDDLDMVNDPERFELNQARDYVRDHIGPLSDMYLKSRETNRVKLHEMGHHIDPQLTPDL